MQSFTILRQDKIVLEENILIFATSRKEAIILHWKVLIFAALKRYLIALKHLKWIIWKTSDKTNRENLSKKFEFDSSNKCDRSIIMVKKIVIYSYYSFSAYYFFITSIETCRPLLYLKGYLCYKAIISVIWGMGEEFFYFIEKSCSVLKIFNFLYF